MPAHIPTHSNNILALPKEDHIQLAIEAIAIAGYESNGNPRVSTRSITNTYHVPRSTLRNRLIGV